MYKLMSMTKLGAILVIGAGVGGIRASVNLAEAGFKVYRGFKGRSGFFLYRRCFLALRR